MHTAARDTSPPRQDQTVPVIEAQNGMSSNNIPPAVSDTRKALAIAVVVSLGASFSPLAANIYYPLLPILSGVFHVSLEKINLSITVYMVSKHKRRAIKELADVDGRSSRLLHPF